MRRKMDHSTAITAFGSCATGLPIGPAEVRVMFKAKTVGDVLARFARPHEPLCVAHLEIRKPFSRRHAELFQKISLQVTRGDAQFFSQPLNPILRPSRL